MDLVTTWPHEMLKQEELPILEANRMSGPRGPAGLSIELEISDSQQGAAPAPVGSPHDGLQAGEKLAERIGLGQIVVASFPHTLYAVGRAGDGAQHQDRGGDI